MELVCANPDCRKAFSRIAKDVRDPDHSFCSRQCSPGRPIGNSPGVQIAYFTCEQCGKLFVRRVKQITKNAAHVVCSNTCRDDVRRECPAAVSCDKCGKVFAPNPANWFRTVYHFCSLDCRDAMHWSKRPPRTLPTEQHTRRERQRENVRAYSKKRRAQKKGSTDNTLTAADWKEMKAIHTNRCVYCGRQMKRLTQDHLTALSRHGTHTKWNVLPACASCNSKKNNRNVLKPVQPLLL
jgi:hypothetical protein